MFVGQDAKSRGENVKNRGKLNFELSSYQSTQGKELPMYLMDKNGFTLLAMGYTDVKALEFKMAYIEAFDAMEAHIREMQKTILTNDELALVFNLINFFRYLEHCKQVEEKHKKTYILGRLKEGKAYGELASTLLEVGA